MTDPQPDQLGPVAANLYRVAASDDVELAITRLTGGGEGPPVVLVHGTFCQRSFWVSQKGIGLGVFLRDRGFDVWIPELRGHGRSRRDRRFRGWSAEDQLRWDLPAIARLVASNTGAPAHWVGHSWGGLAILAAMAGGWLSPRAVRSAVVLGANITEGDSWLKKPLPAAAAWLALTVMGRVPARLFGLGPEPESRAYLLDFFRWKGRVPKWNTREGRSYWQGIRSLAVPLLAFAAADDKNDPASGCRALFDQVGSADKHFVLLGREGGYGHDYQHLEMIVSKAAMVEVWPQIGAWLEAH